METKLEVWIEIHVCFFGTLAYLNIQDILKTIKLRVLAFKPLLFNLFKNCK